MLGKAAPDLCGFGLGPAMKALYQYDHQQEFVTSIHQ
jgi:hypothetical protein